MQYEEFYTEQARKLEAIPPEFHTFLRTQAYKRGHEAGHEATLLVLEGLVFELEEPIKSHAERVLREQKELVKIVEFEISEDEATAFSAEPVRFYNQDLVRGGRLALTKLKELLERPFTQRQDRAAAKSSSSVTSYTSTKDKGRSI